MAKISGGEYLASMLKTEGVDTAFGIVDGTYLGFLAGMRKHAIRMIGPRHETTAAHMAGAYARLTGKLGVCFASNGPGVANLLPGIAVENGEGNRVLAITSSRRTGIAYPDRGGTYQYFNQSGVIKSMAKWSGSVSSPDRIAEMFRRALRISYQGRPGVVHLDIPENIMNSSFELDPIWQPTQYRRTHAMQADPNQIETVVQHLLDSKSLLIHAGSGVIHAQAFAELQQLAEKLNAIVTTSWAARGVLDERLPNCIPMIHVELYHKLRNKADLVLILGSRIGETDWWGKAPYWHKGSGQHIIQVDIDEQVVGMNKAVDQIVIADVKAFLTQINTQLADQESSNRGADRRLATLHNFKAAQKKDRQKLDRDLSKQTSDIHPAQVVHACRSHFADDAIVVFDGGNTAVWGNFYTEVRHANSTLSTFKFGMLGAGLGQALGAAVAFPDRQVYCMIGDGAFGFHPQEIETAIRNQIKVVFIVFVDLQWGMVKMTQQFAFKPIKTMLFKSLDKDETINADFNEIRYDLLAQSMGAWGKRVSTFEELPEALNEASAAQVTAVLHVDVNNVKQMWAPGLLHFKAMHQEPAG